MKRQIWHFLCHLHKNILGWGVVPVSLQAQGDALTPPLRHHFPKQGNVRKTPCANQPLIRCAICWEEDKDGFENLWPEDRM